MQYDRERVTCCIPVYKKYSGLKKAILSVLKQQYHNIELIVCDDGSGDFPQKEIEDYIEKNKHNNLKSVKVYSNSSNLGTVKNFNRAITKATGFYFINVASDDEFVDDKVFDDVVEYINKNNVCMVSSGIVMKTSGKLDGSFMQTNKDIYRINNLSPKQLYNIISRTNIVSGASFSFTQEYIEKYGFYNEKYVYIEDWSRFLRLYREGNHIPFFVRATVYHRMDGISNTRNVPIRYLQDNLNICEGEILNYRKELSFLSWRYNMGRKYILNKRINQCGRLKMTNKLMFVLMYPDVSVLNFVYKVQRKYGRRIKYDKR